MTTWEIIPGYPDHEVSSDGEVRSWKNNRWGRAESPKMMTPSLGNTGYLRVNLEGSVRLIHHLVLEAHIGPRPEGFEGAHFDGNKLNNKLENLRWASPKANGEDNARLGVVKGELHGNHKLTEAEVREILKYEHPYSALAEKLGVSVATIQRIIKRKGWTHVQ